MPRTLLHVERWALVNFAAAATGVAALASHLLLCWRLLPPRQPWVYRVCHSSVSSWKAWLSAYIHLSWIFDWVFDWVCPVVSAGGEAKAFCCIRRKLPSEGQVSWGWQLMILPQQCSSGRVSLWCTTIVCQQQLDKKKIRDFNGKIKIHMYGNKRKAKCLKVQTRIHKVKWHLPFLADIFVAICMRAKCHHTSGA